MSEVYWFLTEYMDETPAHDPTLENAAHFLQHGIGADGDPETGLWGTPPLAKPGDVVTLSKLTMLPDVKAVRVTREDGASGWDFDPPLPPEADFMALRWGKDAGWDSDTICDPRHLVNTDAHFNELCPDYQGLDICEDVAVGIRGEAEAVFYLDGNGAPRLQLIGGLVEVAPLQEQLPLDLSAPEERGLPLLETGPELTRAAHDVVAERRRQVTEEGFTPAQDDAAYACGALGRAAACYARGPQFLDMHKMGDGQGNLVDVPVQWPFPPGWWKPRSRREDLVRAGALILAEIERLDRAAEGLG